MSLEGSVWRKWDLHVHTPASYNWDGPRFCRMNADQAASACRSIVHRMNESDIAAFAIMDYWTFDGYLRLKSFLATNQSVQLQKAMFPGIELRCEAPADFRMNIHVLFSDELSDQQLADFKGALRIPLINRPLSDDAIAEAATKLTPDKLRVIGHREVDLQDPAKRLEIGFKTVLVTRDSFFEAVATVPVGKALIFLPFDTYHGLRQINWKEHPLLTTEFMTRADMFEARHQDAIDAFHGVRTSANAAFFDNFTKSIGGKPKPAVSGSDAHSVSKYGAFPVADSGTRATWVKANPTFRGLSQLRTEPAARIYIGTEPPKLTLVREHPTKYIRSITIRKKEDSDLPEAWFDAEITLNSDLVAIIGNRGNGKSALADVIGRLGRSRSHAHFSFLNKDKFRHPKPNKAKHFDATITWADGEVVSCCLDDDHDPAEVERVRYIPQNYLEVVCNEIKVKSGEGFDYELKSVIFSHVPLAERLGKPTLDELLAQKTRQTNQTIDILKSELHALNEQIAGAESRLTPEHRHALQNRLDLKRQELTALEATRPREILPPSDDPEKQAAVARATADIDSARAELGRVESELLNAQAEQRVLAKATAALNDADGQLANFERLHATLLANLATGLSTLGVAPEALIQLNVDRTPLDAKRAALAAEAATAKHRLDASATGTPAAAKHALVARIAELQANLGGPAKEYQEYITALAAWQAARGAIIGSLDVQGTLTSLTAELSELDQLPARLDALRESRRAKAREIFHEIDRLADTYRAVYQPVQDFSRQHPLINERFGLNFSVSIRTAPALADQFFGIVSRHASGTFCGAEEGEQALKSLVERHDFSSAADALAFAEELLACMTEDRRDGRNAPTSVAKQLKKQQSVEDLYDFIFSFGYLTPEYNLNLGPKSLLQLSPGERGMLLLMFYLLIDKDDIPLIIDQPEGNLDNETVFLQIGECVKEAKRRRQIIIVTHNPNLAVACDAEQIICARLDQTAGNRVEYTVGAIEAPPINRLLINILEGTRPAFDNRDAKYFEEGPRIA